MGKGILIVNQDEVERLLPMSECVDAMEAAFIALAGGSVLQPLRAVTALPGGNVLAFMPSYDSEAKDFAAKIISVFPGNHGGSIDAHQGLVLLFEAEHGSPIAIVDATAITGIRTAAVSAAATRALSRPDSETLGILGAGTQARAHLEAMAAVRPIREAVVWSPFPDEAARFAARESERTGIRVSVAIEAEEAVAGRDIVCAATPAKEPILLGRWLSPGTHVNAIGACTATARELDTEAVRRSALFVDRLESALAEAGDVVIPLGEGAIDRSHIRGELGDVLAGKTPGRASPDEITLFKAVGLAMQDLAAARHVARKAAELGVGTKVALGGRRDR